MQANAVPPDLAGHVLVVDDDRAIRTMLSESLEYEGYLVWTMDDGANVAEALRLASGPVVVLLDLDMPFNGWKVCEQLAVDPSMRRHTVFVVTANRDLPCPTPATKIIWKPFNLDALLAAVAAVLSRSTAVA